ncbi:MAG: hypothetical protein WC846_02525 [Candidatus Gracilibacteria bacterium]|jgi:hypothetical protein
MAQSTQINRERLLFILNGVIDPSIPKQISEIRRALNIPQKGFKTNGECDAWGKQIQEESERLMNNGTKITDTPAGKLNLIKDFIKKNSLQEFPEWTIRGVILYRKLLAVPSGFKFTQIKDSNKPYQKQLESRFAFELQEKNNPSDKELMEAMKILKALNHIDSSLKPSRKIMENIKVIIKSRSKGKPIIDNVTFKESGCISDESIFAEIYENRGDEVHSATRASKNKNLIRAKRSRAKKRIRKYFKT